MADHEDALRYFMITPDTVNLSWEKFMKLPLPTPRDPSANSPQLART